MNESTIKDVLLVLFGGGTLLGIITLVVNKAQRKATLYETMQKATKTHIEEQDKVIEDLKKEKKELFDLYKECVSMKETFISRIHELEIEVQKLKNELTRVNLFRSTENS